MPIPSFIDPTKEEEGPEYITPLEALAKALQRELHERVTPDDAERMVIRVLRALHEVTGDESQWRGTEDDKAELHEVSAAVDVLVGYLGKPRDWTQFPTWRGWDRLRREI
jgi:hypothetical protein